MTKEQTQAISRGEANIKDAVDALTQVLKGAYIGETVEAKIGRHTAYCKVVDAEEGKLVLDNGLRREWQHVAIITIIDRQDEARRHEAGEREGEHDRETA